MEGKRRKLEWIEGELSYNSTVPLLSPQGNLEQEGPSEFSRVWPECPDPYLFINQFLDVGCSTMDHDFGQDGSLQFR